MSPVMLSSCATFCVLTVLERVFEEETPLPSEDPLPMGLPFARGLDRDPESSLNYRVWHRWRATEAVLYQLGKITVLRTSTPLLLSPSLA